jgi:uncharacterized protein (DUF427 family)
MATKLAALLGAAMGDLRYQQTPKRVRAFHGETLVADSAAAVLVWEPRRIVPIYAVPVADLHAELGPAAEPDPSPDGTGPVYPDVAFTVHTTPGTAHDVRTAVGAVPGAAFVPADADLAGHVVLDFDAFTWREEEDVVFSHPRDPFHRVDVRHGAHDVRVEVAGTLVARSGSPLMVFETSLPPRYYLPRGDVLVDLEPSPTRTACPYKGWASHWSVRVGDRLHPDVGWSYEAPLPDAAEIAGAVAFYQERVDLVIDDVPVSRPRTAWS